MSSVATIRMGRERGGALFVYASAYFDGVRYRKKKRVPDDDEELGSEIVRVLTPSIRSAHVTTCRSTSWNWMHT